MRRTKRKHRQKITRSSGKAKARELQKWVCARVAGLTGYAWGMAGDDKPIESRGMGQAGPDVRLESAVLAVFPFSVECKRQENWEVHKWIEQAQGNQLLDTDWLIVAKRSRRPAVVIMDAEAFFDLLGSWSAEHPAVTTARRISRGN